MAAVGRNDVSGLESLDSVVLTVGRASPVACAPSPAVNPWSRESEEVLDDRST
jgi:hypothetical protein